MQKIYDTVFQAYEIVILYNKLYENKPYLPSYKMLL
jgi:hypothetical protein